MAISINKNAQQDDSPDRRIMSLGYHIKLVGGGP